MQGLTTISGLISGMKTDDLIERLLQIERRPILQHQSQQGVLRARIAAFQQANTRLASVQEAAAELARASFFESRTVAASNAAVASATAEAGATPGEYAVTVVSVARAHQLMSQSYEDLDTTRLGTGTFTVTAGGRATTIAVDSSNNTLSGLRDAINAANSNVRAAIIQDGDASYRLMLTSKETGTANAITVNSTPSGDTPPSFSTLQDADDAVVRLGSGASALEVTRSSNMVRDLIPGVTLNLLSESPASAITVTVSADTSRIQESVQKFVDQYNHMVDFIKEQFKFDADTKRGGSLLGDATLRAVQNDLLSVVSGSVPGLSNAALSSVGITMSGEGKLTLNTASFQEALADDPQHVRQVFSLTARTSDAAVRFVSATADTVLDGTAYAVEITQAARQARVTAGDAQTAVLQVDETLTINDVEILLTAGMTQAEVIEAINARTSDTRVRASATAADGTGTGSYLTLHSTAYGSAAGIRVVSSASSAGAPGETSGAGNVEATHDNPGGESGAGTGEAGLDVAGTINGEAATGTGQILAGDTGNATTDGLRLRITATSAGSLGTVQLFNGIANAMKRTLDHLTDAADGPIKIENDSLEARIKDLQEMIDRREAAVLRKEEQLRFKFAQLEASLGTFQNQSAFLTAQINGLPKPK